MTEIPSYAQQEIIHIYRALGGVLDFPTLAPGDWDFAFGDGLLIELDEDLHFNRYRALTLDVSWVQRLPWAGDYRRHCLAGEEMCWKAGRLGGKWTSPSTVKMLGPGDPPGTFTSRGSPRWKQRALYDAVKDAFAVHSDRHRLARISIHDVISGVRVNDFLLGKQSLPERALLEFLDVRSTVIKARS
ncbi:hypothetical protein Q9R30_10110 [Arthrobacter sp. AB6]|uniref:DUF7255 family protein n=1 Tax=Arthrobacter sp. AB6 TaxID=2962570 RepID=UPI002881300D|nr:hypothetical protein [Arthrobacter sp. AB6]MDT0195709.1 hypothetical protein [Arthrobacter sp. AB6]